MAVYNLPVKLVLEVMLVNMKGATLSSNKIILKSHYNKWKSNKMLHLLDYKIMSCVIREYFINCLFANTI